ILARGKVILLAIDRAARRGKDEPARTARDRGVKDVHSAQHVDGGVEEWIRHRPSHVHLRSQVQDRVRPEPPEQWADRLRTNVQRMEGGAGGDGLAASVAEVIDNPNRMATAEELANR